jgi:hypothetical protein
MAKYLVVCVILDAPYYYSMTVFHEVEADKDIDALKSVIEASSGEDWDETARCGPAQVLEKLANPERSTSSAGVTTLSVYVEHEYNPTYYMVKADGSAS